MDGAPTRPPLGPSVQAPGTAHPVATVLAAAGATTPPIARSRVTSAAPAERVGASCVPASTPGRLGATAAGCREPSAGIAPTGLGATATSAVSRPHGSRTEPATGKTTAVTAAAKGPYGPVSCPTTRPPPRTTPTATTPGAGSTRTRRVLRLYATPDRGTSNARARNGTRTGHPPTRAVAPAAVSTIDALTVSAAVEATRRRRRNLDPAAHGRRAPVSHLYGPSTSEAGHAPVGAPLPTKEELIGANFCVR